MHTSRGIGGYPAEVRVVISFQFSLDFASRGSGRVADLKRSPSQIRIDVNLALTLFQPRYDG